MPKSITRTYSRYSREAVGLLGRLLRIARQERRMSVQELADRAGISRGLVQRIEKGDMKCEVGVVFELAAILGVSLFESDERGLKLQSQAAAAQLALLPGAARGVRREVDDDF